MHLCSNIFFHLPTKLRALSALCVVGIMYALTFDLYNHLEKVLHRNKVLAHSNKTNQIIHGEISNSILIV